MGSKIIHIKLLEMAVIIRDILEKHNIPYILTYGSLLGAVRHKGFIPWDDDLDLALFNDSYDEAIRYMKAELPPHLIVEDEESEPNFYHGWSRIKDLSTRLVPESTEYSPGGLRIDLFKLYRMMRKDEADFRYKEEISYIERRLSKGLLSKEAYATRKLKAKLKFEARKKQKLTQDEGERIIYTIPCIYEDRFFAEELFPLKRYKFENEFFYGPANAAPYLKLCYGDYMQLPPIEKRTTHFTNITDKFGFPL